MKALIITLMLRFGKMWVGAVLPAAIVPRYAPHATVLMCWMIWIYRSMKACATGYGIPARWMILPKWQEGRIFVKAVTCANATAITVNLNILWINSTVISVPAVEDARAHVWQR